MPGHPDWFGTPLVHGITNNVLNQVTNVPANATVTAQPTTPISHPGYILTLALTSPVAGTKPWMRVTVRWFDQTGTVQLARTDAAISGSANGSNSAVMQGPVRGAFYRLEFVNQDPAQAQSVTWTMAETSHHLTRDDVRDQFRNAAVTGFASPGLTDMTQNVLGSFSVTVFAPSLTYILPLYSGQAWVNASYNPVVGGQNASFTVFAFDSTAPLFSSPVTTSSQLISAEPITLPRKPCLLTMQGPAGNAVYTITLIAMEYAS